MKTRVRHVIDSRMRKGEVAQFNSSNEREEGGVKQIRQKNRFKTYSCNIVVANLSGSSFILSKRMWCLRGKFICV